MTIEISTPAVPSSTKEMTPPDWSRIRLEQLKFVRHPKGGFGLKMPGNRWVTEATVQVTWRLFWKSVRNLDPARLHTTESMCNDPDWESRPDGERRAMGRCFRLFAERKILPITLVEKPYPPLKFSIQANFAAPPTVH